MIPQLKGEFLGLHNQTQRAETTTAWIPESDEKIPAHLSCHFSLCFSFNFYQTGFLQKSGTLDVGSFRLAAFQLYSHKAFLIIIFCRFLIKKSQVRALIGLAKVKCPPLGPGDEIVWLDHHSRYLWMPAPNPFPSWFWHPDKDCLSWNKMEMSDSCYLIFPCSWG